VASFVSSLLFGAMHEHILAATACGAIYALALYRRGNLGDAILAHATTNALVALGVFTTGAWWLWG
jgi:membrane protease YdiL (CAAX protease family)